MKIGEVAERTGLSLRTIRHYDETGLVVPSARTVGGFRMYTEVEVARLLVIKRMKPLGYSLEEMADLLATDVYKRQVGGGVHPRVRRGAVPRDQLGVVLARSLAGRREMCIRDSHEPARILLALAAWRRRPVLAGPSRARARVCCRLAVRRRPGRDRCHPCLLYTSRCV